FEGILVVLPLQVPAKDIHHVAVEGLELRLMHRPCAIDLGLCERVVEDDTDRGGALAEASRDDMARDARKVGRDCLTMPGLEALQILGPVRTADADPLLEFVVVSVVLRAHRSRCAHRSGSGKPKTFASRRVMRFSVESMYLCMSSLMVLRYMMMSGIPTVTTSPTRPRTRSCGAIKGLRSLARR